MKSTQKQNTNESKRNLKFAWSDTLVMAISLLIIFIFLFATESVGKVAGANDILGAIQRYSL